uniref:Uncharacterized protein n=1 Tax=Peronospora matthiolae TaxID=2874970 RepID=A0AAV1U4K9_9STRA
MDTDVDHIDTDNNGDDDAGIFNNTKGCHTEDDDALTDDDNVLLAVHTKRTAVDKDESEKELLLTREAVVCFV